MRAGQAGRYRKTELTEAERRRLWTAFAEEMAARSLAIRFRISEITVYHERDMWLRTVKK